MNGPTQNEIASMSGVTKIYNGGKSGIPALKNVTFQARKGEMVLILGPSGSGKTTFLTLLAGLQKPSSGNVYLFGKNINSYSAVDLQTIRAQRIGFIFQSFYLIDSLNILENIMLVMKFAGLKREVSKSTAFSYLERFGVEQYAKSSPRFLSQGEKQRVAVARALSCEAPLIIADEPTGSLATGQGMEIVGFIHDSVRSENRCAVISSHDERISKFADRVIRLQDGEISRS
jgi:putative ABC transport system ATP-binding protein